MKNEHTIIPPVIILPILGFKRNQTENKRFYMTKKTETQ